MGEGPGPDEDASGEPFTGRSGQLLDAIVEAFGSKRTQVYMTNTVCCRLDEKRTLRRAHLDACRPFLDTQLEAVGSNVIVALGAVAWRHFAPGDKRKMADVRGRAYLWRERIVVPTYHPAFLLRKPEAKADTWADVRLARRAVEAPLEIAAEAEPAATAGMADAEKGERLF